MKNCLMLLCLIHFKTHRYGLAVVKILVTYLPLLCPNNVVEGDYGEEDDSEEDNSEEYYSEEDDIVGRYSDKHDTGIPKELIRYLRMRKSTLHSPIKWGCLATWKDDNPFIGYRHSAWTSRFTTFPAIIENMYKTIGETLLSQHASKPIDIPERTMQIDIHKTKQKLFFRNPPQ
ncbi:hypothetical protein P153DRAFT_361220 [Dothidotthia symphoricarpi CBS 119687]|uniref:Uncharacterized protein n=1 Tax=Dothidotthia symphoricarpi CBS 119687 TaxID=1392245 RepID=A0A6A6A0N2_9PLEO|nr:uncharacterized protein P153DRAFT_361220 [Dothidotthia symphoricarpi CBS 119687]KAF2124517.1 hypothetical protein P153DRAFT_361220 [Dothidotthia symphoricarpi CBS 119687]